MVVRLRVPLSDRSGGGPLSHAAMTGPPRGIGVTRAGLLRDRMFDPAAPLHERRRIYKLITSQDAPEEPGAFERALKELQDGAEP